MDFTRPILIRFQHCDPAGIVFYPRYFEMCNQMVEDWFAEGLGLSFQRLHQEMGLGVPTVRAECDFTRASRIGDELRFTLRLREVGTKSFQLEVSAAARGEERLRARLTLVCVRLGDTLKSVEIPAPLRATMGKFLIPA
jgi:4-hydroxybenzoyl-CoA thioesterase